MDNETNNGIIVLLIFAILLIMLVLIVVVKYVFGLQLPAENTSNRK